MVVTHSDALSTSPDAKVDILWRDSFKAEWATTDGKIFRTAPSFIDHSPTEQSSADKLTTNREIYPIEHFCIAVPNALLVGQRAVITQGSNELITDSTHINHTSRIFETESRREFERTHLDHCEEGLMLKAGREVIEIEEDVVLLSSMEQDNYGAFLLRVVPKLQAVKLLKLTGLKVIVGAAFEWQIAILSAFGICSSNIIPHDYSKIYRFKNLIIPDMATSEFFPPDCVSRLFDDFIFHKSDQGLGRVNNIYVSRIAQTTRNPSYRPMLNERALAQRLEDLGFTILEPEFLSFIDQVSVFANANKIVGPSGAGMFNSIFSPPHTKVLSLEPMDTWAALHANLYSGRKHEFGMILGGADKTDLTLQKRWSANINLITDRVKQILSQ